MSQNKISMNPQDRYKVIADYPENELPIGSIIQFDTESVLLYLNHKVYGTKKWPFGLASSYYFSHVMKVKEHAHLFRKLSWWEDREAKEMPAYLKTHEGDVIKVKEWKADEDGEQLYFTTEGDELGFYPRKHVPATQEEYESVNTK